jgi:hypothetical protein
LKVNAIYVLSFFAAVMLCGCTLITPSGSLQRPTGSAMQDDYRTAADTWTREGRIYEGLDVKLIAAATYMSPQFRKAFAAEYARRYQLTELEKVNFIKDQENAGTVYDDFIFAAYVPEKEWDDFYKKNSIWKIYITTDNIEQIKPIEIRKLDKHDAKTGYFYSFVTPWRSIYRLRFPKLPAGDGPQDLPDAIKLVITSVLGSAEMVWGSENL